MSVNILKKRQIVGVIAGMLVAGAVQAGHTNTVLIAEMDGREEVGEDLGQRLTGDPDGKGIGYVFGIDGDETTLCYSLLVQDIQLVAVGEGLAAHIHEGQRDTNGPVVAALAGPEGGNASDCLTEGETGKFPTGESGIVQRILNNPANFYINVHNPDFPAGAIRGNLKDTEIDGSHSHDMEGGPSVPNNLTATVYSGTAAEVFWDRSTGSSFVAMYEVYRDGQSVAVVEGNSFFDGGLMPGSSYSYTVIAIDIEGNQSAASSALAVVTP